MKKTIIIIIIALVLVTGIYFGLKYYKKYKDTKMLFPEITGFKFEKDLAGAIAQLSTGYITAIFTVNFINYSSSDFTLNQFYFELFTKDDEYFAGLLEPFNQTILIPATGNVQFDLKVSIKTVGVLALAKSLNLQGTVIQKATELLNRYYINGKLGATVKLKGNFSAEGFKMISLPLELDINI